MPITAGDFVFTHRARIAQKAALRDDEKALLDRVQRVSALDAKTVRVVLRSRFSGWRTLFGNILPRHALAGQNLARIWTDRIDNPKTGRPIASGPFLVERWERGRQLTLVRNPRYWGDPPRPTSTGLSSASKSRASSTRFGAASPTMSRTGFFPPPSPRPALRREQGLRVRRRTTELEPGPLCDQGWGPGGHPGLRNKLVRRALAYGFDRATLVRQVIRGLPSQPPAARQRRFFLTQSSYHRSNWSQYRHRPALARRLLEQAGCRRGAADGIYACAGERLSLRFVTTAGVPPRERLFSLVQAQLRQVGVEVVPTFASRSALFDTILPRGDFDVAGLLGRGFDPSPVIASDIFSCGAIVNWTG